MLVSDISCLREIYGASVNYIDPYDEHTGSIDSNIDMDAGSRNEILDKYDFNKSAKLLLAQLRHGSVI